MTVNVLKYTGPHRCLLCRIKVKLIYNFQPRTQTQSFREQDDEKEHCVSKRGTLESGENYIPRSFTTFVPHQTLFG